MKKPHTPTLAEIKAGAKRASERFEKWPQWKKEISEPKNKMYKFLREVKEIPDNALITKRRGNKRYKVKRIITIYNQLGSNKEIKATEGALFIVDDEGNINMIDSNTEVIHIMDRKDVLEMLGDE
jgi:hypothetical protein